MITVGKTLNNQQEVIDSLMKRSKTANAITIALHNRELFVVLQRNGKPLAKVPFDWVDSAVSEFLSDVEKQMNQLNH